MAYRDRAVPLAVCCALLACSPAGDDTSVYTGASSASGITLGGSESGSGDGDGDTGDGDPSTGDGDPTGPKLDTLPPDPDTSGTTDGCEWIDVLFIVDISASMSEEKANLNANFPNFVSVLDDYVADPQTAALGYRLGLTNSSIVNNAEGQSTFGLDGALYDGQGGGGLWPNCDMGGLLWIDGPGPNVASTFQCAAPTPKSPCMSCTDIGKERPLDAIEMFIEKSAPNGVNEGFYRGEQSLFVVVILTDEDDDANNTTTTPAQTKLALDGFTDGEERYVVVTVAGPQSGGCNSNFGSATAAPLLHEFTNLTVNGVLGDICQGDLSQALAQALDVIQISCDELPPPVG